MEYDPSIDLRRLQYDPDYYDQLKADILLRLFLKAEMRALLFKELDMQVLHGRGSGVLPTGVLGAES